MHNNHSYPFTRMRRNRMQPWLRDITAETEISTKDLILPLFVCDTQGTYAEPITSLPGCFRFSIESLVEHAKKVYDHGIPAIALFPYVEDHLKTADCREAYNDDNLIARTLRALNKAVPKLGVLCDIALDPYNLYGHDGIVQDGMILNDETIEVLKKQALCMANNGASALAPSDMMDGRIAAIRSCLEEKGHINLPIISYSAKYASCFYGPFRDAVGSSGNLSGDKKTYQMNPKNANEAHMEVALDFEEGADMVIIKPGMAYLDIIYRIKQEFKRPVLAYQVSGEYAMIMAAAQNGWLDGDAALMESMISFKRAGCDAVLTYGALRIAEILNN